MPPAPHPRRNWLLTLGILSVLACLVLLWFSVSPQPRRWGLWAPSPGWTGGGCAILGALGILLLHSAALPAAGAQRRGGLWTVLALTALAAYVLSILAMVFADIFYMSVQDMLQVVREKQLLRHDAAANVSEYFYPVLDALKLSALTSLAALVLVLLFAIPIGYALSRCRFAGASLVNALIDLPMVMPSLIIGVSLLVFFQAPLGRWITRAGLEFVFTVQGIVLCQFFCSASYGIRSAKAAFDAVDVRLEQLAMTLGCTRAGALRRVVLPQARGGLLAGGIIAWAHAVGLFAPLQVFSGAVAGKTAVLPTTIFLELSNGKIERALAVSMIMLVFSLIALVLVHALLPSPPGRRRAA